VLLEMAVVRLSRLDELVPVAQLAQWLSQPGTARPAAQTPQGADSSKKNGSMSLGEAYRAGNNGHSATPQAATELVQIDDANLSLVWDKVKLEAGVMLAGQLARAGVPAIIGPKTLVLRFGPGYTHEYEFCRDAARTRLVEGLLKKATGQDWALRFEMDTKAVAAAPAVPVLSNRERERRALEAPLLSRIVSGLEGRLLKMDEGFGEGAASEESG
jgi:DNA polymerase III subunit gamma/tau